MLSGVLKFYKDLPSGHKDLFLDVVRGFVEDCNPITLKKYDREINRLKNQIDRINIERGILSTELSKAKTLLGKLNLHMRLNKESNLEMFQGWLYEYTKSLRRRIVELKPLDDLRRKYLLKVERQDLIERQQIGQVLLNEVSGSKDKIESQPIQLPEGEENGTDIREEAKKDLQEV